MERLEAYRRAFLYSLDFPKRSLGSGAKLFTWQRNIRDYQGYSSYFLSGCINICLLNYKTYVIEESVGDLSMNLKVQSKYLRLRAAEVITL